MDYNKIQSLSKDEFEGLLTNTAKLVPQTEETLEKIERVLDIMPGVLRQVPQGFSNSECACGHEITLYDFVISAIVDGNHPKSFVLHALLGSKYIIGEPRPVRCIECGMVSAQRHSYDMTRYACKVEL